MLILQGGGLSCERAGSVVSEAPPSLYLAVSFKIKIKKKIKWREKQGKLQRSAQVSEWGNQERAMSGRPNEEASTKKEIKAK